jgi:hypothetical protein
VKLTEAAKPYLERKEVSFAQEQYLAWRLAEEKQRDVPGPFVEVVKHWRAHGLPPATGVDTRRGAGQFAPLWL